MYTLDKIAGRLTEKVGDKQLTTLSISAGVGFVSQAEKFSRDISGKQYDNYIFLQKGDFSYNKGNSKKFPQGCIYELKEYDEAAVPNAFISFRFNKSYVSDFYKGYFENNFHGKQLMKFITSGARMDGLLNINPSDFFSIILPTPKDKAEQQKIADCLASLDDLISAEDKRLESLNAHKKGLMQKLFPAERKTVPEWRFPEFRSSGEWEEKNFGELCDFTRGPFGGTLKKEIFVKNGYAVYEQSHAIYSNFNSFRYYITKEKYDELKRFSVHADDIIMSCSGTMGKFAIVPKGAKEGVINQALLKLAVKKGIDIKFVKMTLELDVNQEKLLSQSAGGAIKNVVAVSQMKEIPLLIPHIFEQQKIADCLTSIDNLITGQTQKIEALKTHKKGLMQGLFPSIGEVSE